MFLSLTGPFVNGFRAKNSVFSEAILVDETCLHIRTAFVNLNGDEVITSPAIRLLSLRAYERQVSFVLAASTQRKRLKL